MSPGRVQLSPTTHHHRFVVRVSPRLRQTVALEFRGEIDLANVDEFAESIAAFTSAPGSPVRVEQACRYRFDLTATSFMSVGALAVLVEGATDLARRGAEVEVCGATRIQQFVIGRLDDGAGIRFTSPRRSAS